MSILLYRNYFYHASANNALSHFTLVIVAAAIGYGAAAVITPIVSPRLPDGSLITIMLLVAGIVCGTLGVTFSQVPFLFISFALGLAAQCVAITATTIIQREVDDVFRGRVFSFYDMLFNVPFVIGAAVAAAFMPFDGKSYALIGVASGGYVLAAVAYSLLSRQRSAADPRPRRSAPPPPPSAAAREPTQPTFCRMLQRVDAAKVEQAILAIQEQMRGPAPKEQLIVLDGKEPRHGSGASILSAVTVPSQHYLGSALVDQKTNEIPVARELFHRLQLEERLVSLDALHTQDETARALVLEHGADYLLTVKGNQPTVRARSKHSSPFRRAIFPPLESTPTKARMQQINKKRQESRSICTAPVTGEQVCFPLAEQAALLLRQTEGRKDELVASSPVLSPHDSMRQTGCV